MEFLSFTGLTMWWILLFVGWSGLLVLFAGVLNKVSSTVTLWSRFWFVWLLLTLVPLVPISVEHKIPLIPDVLKQPLPEPGTSLFLDSYSMLSQGDSIGSLEFLLSLLFITLALGSCIGFARFVVSLVKTNGIIGRALVLNDLGQLKQRHQDTIKKGVISVRITDEAISPLVYGFFRVTLLLPESVFSMPERQRDLLIEHELTHIRRHDPQLVLIFRFCACVFWFNPFVQYFEKRFLQSMEMNCDAEVVQAFPKFKLDYAQALLASLTFSKTSAEHRLMTYFSGPGFDKNDFEARIKQAMSKSLHTRYGARYRVLLAVMFCSVGFFATAAKPFEPARNLAFANDFSVKPVASGWVSSGYKDISAFRGNKPHKAIDFAAPTGTEVVASFSGTVLIADDVTLHQNYGKVVLIEHKEQMQSLYAHLDSISVKPGQYVAAGSQLGTVGETGRTTGPHLHFEVLKNGKRTDPNQFLNLNMD